MSDPVLSIRGLERTYVTAAGSLSVLKGVDLDVQPGEIVGLIGPSGSGKSSLLHAAGLLEHPDAGQITIQGVDCSNLGERARTQVRLSTIGFVYQFHHLLPEFSALDNVALPRMIAGEDRKAATARAVELLAGLGLKDRVHHEPAQLSGGEQQRVAVARAGDRRARGGGRLGAELRRARLGGVELACARRPRVGRSRPSVDDGGS